MKTRGLVRQHIESFNYLIEQEIGHIMEANRRVTCSADPNWFLEYKRIWVGAPEVEENYIRSPVTPQQCRLRDMTYAAPIYVDIDYVRGNVVVQKQGVCIGRIPLMLRSNRCILHGADFERLTQLKECPYDPGGYFIVKGVEKVILIQEQLSNNRVIVGYDKRGAVTASVTSSTHERKSKTHIMTKKAGGYLVSHNSLTEDVPIFIIFKAMGLESEQEIVQLIGSEFLDLLVPSIAAAREEGVLTKTQALEFIGARVKQMKRPGSFRKPKVDLARDTLAGMILSHIPVREFNFQGKAIYLALMVRRVLLAVRDPESHGADDKDYYGNKRLEMAGQLLALLFEDLFKRFNSELARNAEAVFNKPVRATPFDVLSCIRQDTITNGLANAISTGNWNVKRFRMERAGVTQMLSRLSFISVLGMMTRITSQFEKTRKVSGPRALQCSQWGVVCPSDTPEGESCGLVKNLALLTHVTTSADDTQLLRLSTTLGMESVEAISSADMSDPTVYMVLCNGRLVGVHRQPVKFTRELRQLRRRGLVTPFASVYLRKEHRSVFLATDGGRVCRPMLIVEDGKPLLQPHHLDQIQAGTITFNDLLRLGCLEYLDVNEENNCRFALKESDIIPETTHLEIDPLTILGVVAGLIPYPHHNQSPRNTYQCAMGKQSIGSIAYNQYNRIDTLLYILVYPQPPMVKTKVIDMIGFNQLPSGQNAIMAIMSYTGYDIEDAIVLNKASLDRGFGRCLVLRKNNASIKRYPNQTKDRIVRISPELAKAAAASGAGVPVGGNLPAESPSGLGGRDIPTMDSIPSYQRRLKGLDVDGIARLGEVITNGQVLVNRDVPKNTSDMLADPSALKDGDYASFPVSYKGVTPTIVDKVLLTSNSSDNFIIKMLMRSTRRPEIGDKYSSRHGQKGVCGIVVPQEDMPFSDSGICPDLIMNPHGLPSRMTVGKLIELLGGKVSESIPFGCFFL